MGLLCLNVITGWCPSGYETYFMGLSTEKNCRNLFNALLAARVLWLSGRDDSHENIVL
jgi:hypothetical protein